MTRRTLLILVSLSLLLISFYLPKAQSAAAPNILFIERFSTDTSMADGGRKAERIEDIPESKLIQIQEVLWREIKHTKIFTDVRILKPGEKPVMEEGQTGWVLGGQFLDYKKGNQVARYMIGLGAGKQKVEVMVDIRDARSGVTVRKERVVDRKVGGWFGGDAEKGLKDFAERIIELINRTISGKE
jgi:hypothetical protein